MAKKLPKTDVVTVGVGWVGGIIAAELTKKGYKVVGLERGKGRSTEDYLKVHDELRYAQRYELMQDLSRETITIRHDLKKKALPYREWGAFLFGDGLGGSGVHWNGQTYLFLPYDFEIYSKTVERYGKNKIPKGMTIQDWGITHDELLPYYNTFLKMSGISGEPNPLKGSPQYKYPTKPMLDSPEMKLFKEAANKLGYHPYSMPSANLSENYTNPDNISRGACQYCGFCERFGCEYGAKADPVVTVLPVAEKTGNYELRTHSVVRKVLHSGGKATGVLYVDTRTGEEYIQEAEVVLLSAYQMNNVKIMLNSNLGKAYDPKTGRGVIGKNYAYQVNFGASTGFFDNEYNAFAGAGALGANLDDFNGDFFDHSDLDFIHGANIRYGQSGNRPIQNNATPAGTPTWGKEFKDASVKYANRTISIGAQGASMPWQDNYLDLDPTYKDAFGDPLIRMTFNWKDQDRQLSKFLGEKTAGMLKEMGATKVNQGGQKVGNFDVRNYQSTHNTGGSIMGADPETSALNNYLQMWDCENVFSAGANAFGHNSGYNPTGTVGALAYRAAEGIEKYLKKGGSLV
ncbi:MULTISPECIES: GMC family oxidoreductase [Heyndrickxia]|jgi:gluconate 2-dehydrogenase alpha chain|uniref:GMC family oxidoreductase n=1 Tax=Heyndrickxia oleronia TaxID=38875 RepID=A0A8E2LHA7_9BACI|nr:GMC family oxidoreductase [Heyndrickxia oleronia]OJH18480.1 GMC family oxidoreductase [Bacillus obstructivus]MBU5211370.1 GMC family oxidoreductase [Heyndrickxia oleronia]MCI1590823.1 GMC family oxidoreductase [Heyndrickxia oleronia]MCI1612820.1 GMC family oxidoreductase [Heyndrickxia oleronia]MCI1744046.1 GMC family oxidoreductase [Heyndrickxia oleronia]